MPFDAAFQQLIEIEGGYSDHASDRGKKTKFGITEGVARANGFEGDMRDLQLRDAQAIFRRQYWDTLRLDEIDALSESVALELFDTAVNMGVTVAGRFLQRCLNAFNRLGQDYPDVKADGLVGQLTIDALKAYLRHRGRDGELVLQTALNSLQGARYIGIVEADREMETFVFGWFKQRVVIYEPKA